jgi:hypothetical protein
MKKNEFFEMPVDRLMSEEEVLVLLSDGVEVDWIECKGCSNQGGTTDAREYCSVECYAREKGIDKKNAELIKRSVFMEKAAKKGDCVFYNERYYVVKETDCTMQRIKRGYGMKYNYILSSDSGITKLEGLEMPLFKYVKTHEQ